MLPGQRGLQVFLPLFLYWGRKWNRPVRYIVIGGWLPEMLARKSWLRHLCSRLAGIYVETASMASKLFELGLRRVWVLPNFRRFSRTMNRQPASATLPLKLVFFSRVMKEKGIEEAIAAVCRLNHPGTSKPAVTLDVYGPVPRCYRDELEGLIKQSPHIRYRGVLSPDKAHGALQEYDLMLFPTYYEGEGFPGAIVDSFIAGVPVVASDWRYNREIIDDGKTGVLCAPRSVDDLVDKLRQFAAFPEQIAAMRQHCIRKASRYHVEYAVEQLLRDMSGHMPIDPWNTREWTQPISLGGSL
jgi:glycosyltransferase involved in cell wall biosynthesis